MPQHLSVMVVGSGAREHAISSAYEKSRHVGRIIVAPGNDFIGFKRQKEVLIEKGCSLKDPESILRIARKYKPDLIDVAQDNALERGTVDVLNKSGFQTFGPTRGSARIEWDKRWSREFMERHGIPQPEFSYFDKRRPAIRHVKGIYRRDPEFLLYTKATGLCSGKGALKSTNSREAIRNIKKMKMFPDGAGDVFLVEEGLRGEEFSYYAISDGSTYHPFKSAQDNKTVFDFDEGDQTGGMGAVSPAKVTDGISQQIEEEQIARAIEGMASEGIPYEGILYLGGIVVNGKPMNIEYNARWGDPECQAVLPSVETDYIDVIQACKEGKLSGIKIRQDGKTRVCVVGASRGYPGNYDNVKGKRVYGIERAMGMDGVRIFGAGIDVRDKKFYASGGRLFSVVAEGNDILEARQKAYSAIACISIEGNNLHYRTDIGWRDLRRFWNHN
ncbi:MAG: phosphoribosylamine--glycine ligase [Candidatus Aenigmarchaeota archaeon]|nr:phosphoribosylamine--glycine ligase [Candidatus Aenigmarchaeota archaeon]